VVHAKLDENPSWSADGNQIVFQSNRDGKFEIYVMDSDGSNQARLTNNPAIDYDPDW
jgi:Tol biopolymer transport system component